MHDCATSAQHEQLLIQRDGRITVVLVCACSKKIKALRAAHERDRELVVYRDNRCERCHGVGCDECHGDPCARCGSFDHVEWHHWAPQALFEDAEDWPMAQLCRSCHTLWHQRVTPHLNRRIA